MIWYFENYQALQAEREALEALASRENWLTPLGWRIDDSARSFGTPTSLTPAGNRPISLASTRITFLIPLLSSCRAATDALVQHQYGAGGELCLEYGPDNWHQDFTGADMIASAHRLAGGRRADGGLQPRGGLAPSDHHWTGSTGSIQPLPDHSCPWMKNFGALPDGCRWRLPSIAAIYHS